MCLHLVYTASSWLPTQLCMVMFYLGEHMRLSMVFISLISLLLKWQFAHCSWACWQTSSGLLNIPFAPQNLVSLIIWAGVDS